MYGVVASRSLTDADEAINSVDEAKTVLSIYVDAVIEQLGFVTADIQACAGDAACLDGLVSRSSNIFLTDLKLSFLSYSTRTTTS